MFELLGSETNHEAAVKHWKRELEDYYSILPTNLQVEFTKAVNETKKTKEKKPTTK